MAVAERRRLNPCWGFAILAVVAWHGIVISRTLGLDYLLSLCYLSHILLATGILVRSAPLVGTGFGWALIALPLWIFDSIHAGRLMFSSLAFHTIGIAVGFLALRRMTLPGWLAVVALPIGLLSFLLARFCTRLEFNINAAFRVQEGWELIFPDYRVYLVVQLAVYAMIFCILPAVNNRFVFAGEKT